MNNNAFKNKIINGCFRINQREDTNTDAYYLDRWRWRSVGQTGGTITQEHTSNYLPSGDFVNTLTATINNQTNYTHATQAIESVITLAGQDVVFSVWIKPSEDLYAQLHLYQYFGALAPTSTSVYYGDTPELISGNQWTKLVFKTTFASLEGKDISSDNTDQIITQIAFGQNSSMNLPAPDCTVEIANVQLEEGINDTEFEIRPITIEEELCYRYYVSTKIGSRRSMNIMGQGIHGERIGANVKFPVPMREVPTCEIFSNGSAPQLGYVEIYNGSTQYGPGAEAGKITMSGFQRVANINSTINIGGHYMFRYTADAEF